MLGSYLAADDGDHQSGTGWLLGPRRVAVRQHDHDIRTRMRRLCRSNPDTQVGTAATHQSDVVDAAHPRGGSDRGVTRQDLQSTRTDASSPNHTSDLRQRGIELRLAHAAGGVDDNGDGDERALHRRGDDVRDAPPSRSTVGVVTAAGHVSNRASDGRGEHPPPRDLWTSQCRIRPALPTLRKGAAAVVGHVFADRLGDPAPRHAGFCLANCRRGSIVGGHFPRLNRPTGTRAAAGPGIRVGSRTSSAAERRTTYRQSPIGKLSIVRLLDAALLEAADLIELGDYQCYARLSHAGERLPTFHLRLDSPPAPDPVLRALLVARSDERYGRQPGEVAAARGALLDRMARLAQPQAAEPTHTDTGGQRQTDPDNGRLMPTSAGQVTGPPLRSSRSDNRQGKPGKNAAPLAQLNLQLAAVPAADSMASKLDELDKDEPASASVDEQESTEV